MLWALIASVFISNASAVSLPSEQKNYVQDIRIVSTSTSPASGSLPSEQSNYVLDTRVYGLILSTQVAYTNQSNTFTSSQTIRDGTGGGLLVVGDSVTASAFFGDGSHLTGVATSGGSQNTFNSSVTVNNSSFTFNGVNGYIASQSSITTNGGFFGDGSHLSRIPSTASIVGVYLPLAGGTMTGALTNNAGITVSTSASSNLPAIKVNSDNTVALFNAASSTGSPNMGIFFIDYTHVSGTTMTVTAAQDTVFSTFTLPANSFTKPGQGILVTCTYNIGISGNNITPKIFARVGAPSNNIGNTQALNTSNGIAYAIANLQWLGPASEISWGSMWKGTQAFNSPGTSTTWPNQSLDETSAWTINCACLEATSPNHCSFLTMRVDWLGM